MYDDIMFMESTDMVDVDDAAEEMQDAMDDITTSEMDSDHEIIDSLVGEEINTMVSDDDEEDYDDCGCEDDDEEEYNDEEEG